LIRFVGVILPALADEAWEAELNRMPLATNRIHFSKSEPAEIILRALQTSVVVKAIVFLPSATDELYFNDRGSVVFTNSTPTVLDAISALTQHTGIRAIFRAPFLMLGETNDFFAPLLKSMDSPLFEKLRQKPFTPEWVMIDKEWDQLYPTLKKHLETRLAPLTGSSDSWHFYRTYFAAHDLNALEAVELVSLATKTEVAAEKHRLKFSKRSQISPKNPD
jgi:hypothetical protein